jgi:transcriptional regulator with XRE-family HTH domain
MDDARIGRVARQLRRRKGWRQKDVAARVGCHQTTISRLERGYWTALSLALVRRIFAELGGGFEGLVKWRAGDVDRLLDEKHAEILEAVARRSSGSWLLHPEVTYSVYGERGSIDLLALREADLAAVVYEIKGDMTSVEATIRKHGDKTRLAARIILNNWGWRPKQIAKILVVEDTMTARRVVSRHEATFRAAYPTPTSVMRRWLRDPHGDIASVWFLSLKHPGAARAAGRGRSRIRRHRPSAI